MPYDGSGVYSLTYTFATEAASPPIAISKLDTEFAGIATALSLCVLRNGNGVPTANTPWNNKKITGLADATADTDALNRQTGDARYAQLGTAVTFSGAVTGTGLIASGAAPYVLLTETDGSTDEKNWGWFVQGEAAYLYALTDDLNTGIPAITVNRTGTTIDSVEVSGTAVTINGNTAWHAGNDGTGSGLDADLLDGKQATDFVLASAVTSGTFTARLRATDDGADLATGTAFWRKFNNVVTLRLPMLAAETTATTFYVTGIPADIQVGTLAEATQQLVPAIVVNDAFARLGLAQIGQGQAYLILYSSVEPWTSVASTKGAAHCTITYQIAD